MKKLLAYVLFLFTLISCLQEERSPEEILVPTPAQVEYSDVSLVFSAKVPSGSEKLVHGCGFLYGKDKLLADASKVEATMTANSFSAELPKREYGTTYYICSYVTNGHGSEIRSDLRSYTLEELDDYVKFGTFNMQSYNKTDKVLEVTLNADIWGGVKVTEIGICYGESPTGLTVLGQHQAGVWERTETKSDAGVVTVSIKGLEDAKQYYFRAYVKDMDYISYGDVVPFYIPSIPVVQTGEVGDITPYTAALNGEVLDECGSPVTERGFVWNEGTVAPTIESQKSVVDGALGAMTAVAEGLLPNRTYTYSAYAVNVSGVAYGTPVTFTTLVALPDLTTADITTVTSNSATFSGTVTNDGGETVSEVGFYYSTDSAVDPEKSEKVSQEYTAYARSAAEYAANTLYSAMSAGAEVPAKSAGVATKAGSDGYSFSIDVYGLALKTRYYVKPYAVNSAGVAYGKVANFETMGEIPTVKTSGTSELTTSSVVLSGEVVADNGERITERGFVWMEGVGTPTTASTKAKVSGTTGAYTYTLTNLQPNRKYSFCAYAINAEGTSYGEVVTFTTLVALPVVTPAVVSSVTSTSATLSGTVKDHGGETVYEVGFYYSTDSSVDPSVSQKVSQPYSSDSFSVDVTELAVNTKYYVKSFATNSAGSSYSTVTEFTTSASFPTVNTNGASDVTESSALLSGEVVSDNGAAITERGFVWVKGSDTPTTSSNKLKVDGTTGTFTATLSNIDPNQKYSFRAYAINSKGTAYGEVMTFNTVAGLPLLAAVEVSGITSTSATFSSKVLDHGGATVSEVGFYYSTSPEVDPSSSEKVSRQYSNDLFSMEVVNLQIFTKYYVKAYTMNTAGTVYSDVVSFTTEASTPVVNTVGSSEVSASGAKLSGTVVTDNGATITERGFVWVKGTDTPTTSSNRVKVGGTTGDYTTSLTDLEPNQKYSFRAYAINSVGTSYGEIKTFTTVPGLPTLSALGVSSVTTTTATFTSTVTSHGGETVGAVGFYYSTTSPIDIETAEKVAMAYVEDRFTHKAEGLAVGTQYYVMAFASNTAGEVVNAEVGFKTVSTAPTVVTKGHSELTSSSAKLSGEVVLDNGEPISERGFVWLKGQGEPTTSSTKVKVDGKIGEYTATLSGLDPNQTYSYRAFASNSKGTAYGEVTNFRTLAALPQVEIQGVFEITSTTAEIDAKVTYNGGETPSEAGFLYGTTSSLDPATASKVVASNISDNGIFRKPISGLTRATLYYVRPYATNSAGTAYGEVVSFKTLPELPVVITNEVTDITDNSALLGGTITDDGGSDILSKGIVWDKKPNPTISLSTKTDDGPGASSFTSQMSDLVSGTTYYVRAYATNAAGTSYGQELVFKTTVYVLFEAANSFIISYPGTYSFKTVKGNSSESVGSVASAEVLWDSFGTSETPEVGSLVSSVSVQGDAIVFEVVEPYREGNAVIAAKDASGTILWSWHIWLTDEPEGQVYYNNAGTMMDRNLGATSATPGDVGALGLLYQWGRKDPFLSGASINSDTEAKSTLTWPSKVSSNSTNGTIKYATEHPTTFITYNSNNYDWYYTGSSSTDNTRWQSDKTIYDPCPVGWRVPDGDSNGVWSNAVGSSSYFEGYPYDSTNQGMNFSGKFGEVSTIWYPASGYRGSGDGALGSVGYSGSYWSVTPSDFDAYRLFFRRNGYVEPSYDFHRAFGFGVRCVQE